MLDALREKNEKKNLSEMIFRRISIEGKKGTAWGRGRGELK